MKYSSIIIIIASLLFSVNLDAQTKKKNKERDQFSVQVDGLGCPFCAFGLEKKFKELNGIKDLVIEIETGVMDFSYPSANVLTIDAVAQQVLDAGYTPIVVNIERADGTIEKEVLKTEESTTAEEVETVTFFVAGNCGMCKTRIEEAATTVDGVTSASWDQEKEMLTTTFDTEKTNRKMIEEAIAKVGHDTENVKTDDETYNNLHGCCKYERKE